MRKTRLFRSAGARWHVRFMTLLLFISVAAWMMLHIKNSLADDAPVTIGAPLTGLTSAELTYFEDGRQRFVEVTSVQGTEPGAPGKGLGPRFNMNSCAGCHLYPAIGGSSPPVNPQVAVANEYGAQNQIPYFIRQNGPIREARFKFNQDGTRDGGVHALFVITGRADAGSCHIAQPAFHQAGARNNISLRIPTPLFGAGLIEAIPDNVIIANANSNQSAKNALGIHGHVSHIKISNIQGSPNISANDGTISRFGWKAQNKSLLIFSGEAYNVEQGVTNEVFPNERDETTGCDINGTPEDKTRFEAATPSDVLSDIIGFTNFMRFLAPPQPKPLTESGKKGKALFSSVGCAMCHTPAMTTGQSSSAALSNQTVNLYSDLLVHHMGPGLADNIIQGDAGPDEFRTAPLWGVGSRLFFLHDGRATDLMSAIQAHASTNARCKGNQKLATDGIACTSEANKVIIQFNRLTAQDKADLIEFLQSL